MVPQKGTAAQDATRRGGRKQAIKTGTAAYHECAPRAIGSELRSIAQLVQGIGRGRRATPESILIEKHEAAARLLNLARLAERNPYAHEIEDEHLAPDFRRRRR